MYGRIGDQRDYEYKQQDPQYQGEPLDRQLANGPNEQRKIRDCLFCILYLVFWAALIIVAIFAFSKGQPHLLAAPFDSTGRQCGYSQGYQNFPYGYYSSTNHSKFVCASQCPTNSTSKINCMWNNTVNLGCNGVGIYSTIKIVSFCYPASESITQMSQLGLGFFQRAISDLSNTWPISLSIIFMTLIVSIGFLFFVRACGGCLIWTTILIYFLLLVGFGVLAFETAQNRITINGLDDLNDPQLLKWMAYISWSIAGISLLLLLCCIGKIRIATTVMKVTAQFTKDQFQAILVPVFMFVAIAIFFALWITVSIYIFSSGKVGQCAGTPYACIDWDIGVKRSLALYFFGLFWNSQVAIGMCQFVIASTCSYWYFSHLNKSQPNSPVCKSFCRALFYHLGSIALGALILCILWLLQLMLELFHVAAKKQSISTDPVTNACADYCIKCLRCCIACFQRFIRFISRNAFIMMAITGQGFCTSAHQAFYLILRSSRAYAITHGVGHLIMFFGKLMITIGCTISGYLMITQISYFSDNIYSPFMPTLIFFVISFVISSLFMDVFGIGSDTLLLCYCLQMDILKGLSYACPGNLKNILEEYRQ